MTTNLFWVSLVLFKNKTIMNYTKLVTLSILLLFICVWSFETHSMSGGALEVTGSTPGENCTGCHQGIANTDSKGGIAIAIAGNPTYYEPGKTYDMSVTINYPSRTRFGFGLNIRKKGNVWQPIGSLTAENNSGVSARGTFATHELKSIDAPNSKTWLFKWTAPQTLDTFTFYTSGIAANNDKDATGDITYTTSKTIFPSITTSDKSIKPLLLKGIYPNPTQNEIEVEMEVSSPDFFEISLLDINGNLKETLLPKTLLSGNQQLQFKFINEYPKGIYFLKVFSKNHNSYKKIIIL